MIKINQLYFHYKAKRPILQNVSTVLRPGSIYGLLGLNGVGKTTLLKLIAGLSFPKAGTIQVNQHVPEQRQVSFLSDLYFITDEVDLPNWSIQTFLSIYSPLYPNFDRNYFDRLLSQFLVEKDSDLKDLSYGQRKKVNIAFGLACNTSVLLMDEPTNGLDIPSKTQFRKVISKHINDDKILIISTHQIRDIHHLMDHLLVLDRTRLTVDCSLAELSAQYAFVNSIADGQKSLYSESTIHGERYLIENTGEYDSAFDIEMFFNALSENPELTSNIHSPNPTLS